MPMHTHDFWHTLIINDLNTYVFARCSLSLLCLHQFLSCVAWKACGQIQFLMVEYVALYRIFFTDFHVLRLTTVLITSSLSHQHVCVKGDKWQSQSVWNTIYWGQFWTTTSMAFTIVRNMAIHSGKQLVEICEMWSIVYLNSVAVVDILVFMDQEDGHTFVVMFNQLLLCGHDLVRRFHHFKLNISCGDDDITHYQTHYAFRLKF